MLEIVVRFQGSIHPPRGEKLLLFLPEQIMVVGANEKFTAALIIPDFVFLHNWCTLHNVKFRENDDLIKKQVVIDRYQREIDKYNEELFPAF